MERVVEYMLKVIKRAMKGLLNTHLRLKKVPHINFLELHGKQAKTSKRRIKLCVLVEWKIWKNGLVDRMEYSCFMMHH